MTNDTQRAATNTNITNNMIVERAWKLAKKYTNIPEKKFREKFA